MTRPHTFFRIGAALLTLLIAGACSSDKKPAPTVIPPCDRTCLEQWVDRYLEALVAHDPAKIPITDDAMSFQNGQPVKPGDGSWQTVQSLGAYKHYIADPETRQVAFIGTVRENDAEALLTLRLKIDADSVGEAELVITHDPQGAAKFAELGKPDADWLRTVPAKDRVSREVLTATADKYFQAMERNDGKGDYSFFADDCKSLQTFAYSDDAGFVALDCRERFQTGLLGVVTRVRDRRHEVIDVERQAMFSIASLDHDGTIRNIALTAGTNFRILPYFSVSRTLQVGEALRFDKGRIRDVAATMHEFPYGMLTAFREAWTPARTVPSGKAAEAPGAVCDRACLDDIVEQVLQAFIAHDPATAPLAQAVTFTQNDQRLEVGDGLWGTLTKVGAWRVKFADPTTGHAGVLAQTTETDIPGLLALRIKVEGGRVTQIEANITREEKPGQGELFRAPLLVEVNTAQLGRADALWAKPVSEAARTSREVMTRLVKEYFDALEKGKGGAVAFSTDCVRRENGTPVTASQTKAVGTVWSGATASPGAESTQDFRPYKLSCQEQLNSGYSTYVDQIRNRRTIAVDEERGLVYAMAYLDIPGTVKSIDVPGAGGVTLPTLLGRPHTIASPHLFRIEKDQIRRIESLGQSAPFGFDPQWKIPKPTL